MSQIKTALKWIYCIRNALIPLRFLQSLCRTKRFANFCLIFETRIPCFREPNKNEPNSYQRIKRTREHERKKRNVVWLLQVVSIKRLDFFQWICIVKCTSAFPVSFWELVENAADKQQLFKRWPAPVRVILQGTISAIFLALIYLAMDPSWNRCTFSMKSVQLVK